MVSLGEVADLNPRLGCSLRDSDGVTFVPMPSLDAYSATTTSEEVVPYGTVKKGYTPFRNGDILIAKITPCFENSKIGRATLTTEVGFGSTEFHIIRPQTNILDRDYALHMLRGRHFIETGALRMTGSGGQRRVPLNVLKDYAIPLPPLWEQRRIARILQTAEDSNLKSLTSNESLDNLLLQQAAHLHRKPGTARVSISTIVQSFVSGRSFPDTENQSSASWSVLRVGAVSSGTFKPHQAKPLDASYVPPKQHRVNNGDLLINRSNTRELVGSATYVWCDAGKIAIPDKIWRVKWVGSNQTPQYFLTTLRAAQVRKQITGRATGTSASMLNISKKDMLDVIIPWPSYKERVEFEQFARAVRRAQGLIDRQRVRTRELYNSLQHRAFRGEL